MRILLVHPDFPRQIQQPELLRVGYNPPALGINILAAILRTHGHEVETMDSLRALLRRISNSDIDVNEEALRRMRDEPFDLVGLNVTSPTRILAMQLARSIREQYPNTIIIFGGPHATIMGKRILARYRTILDGVVLGEGEESFPKLVESLEAGIAPVGIPGVIYKDVVGGPPALVTNLDKYPIPDYDAYRADDKIGVFDTIPIMTSRGCPQRCAFCYSTSFWNGRFRSQHPNRVVDEIEYGVRGLGITKIHFNDDTLSRPLNRIKIILKEILNRGISASLYCNTRIDCIDDEFLSLYEAIGGGCIYFGIESGSERIRNAMRKDLTDDNIIAGYNLVRNRSIRIGFFLIFGYPTETDEDVALTKALLRHIPPDEVTCNIAHVHPGTEMFQIACREKKYTFDDWLREDPHFFPYERDPGRLAHLTSICEDFEQCFGPPLSRSAFCADIGSVNRDKFSVLDTQTMVSFTEQTAHL